MDAGADAAGGTQHRWSVRVYWEDTDAGGIVYYANYLKFFERARTEWLRQLGLEQQVLRQRHGGMFVVAEAHVRYLRPARLDDALHIVTTSTELGRASVTLAQRAEHTDGTVLCAGQVRIGWVEVATLRPARLPSELARALAPLATDSARTPS
ncbi:tol-pal system-associated acyl-CoA thioesterase [Tepidimonas charontis]|uniref:tol-pal system-associated acyl-CoA thioesterase n=1 Tax=Tepidimonas charontis TaxID=2267262 RepID=UPI0038B66DC1